MTALQTYLAALAPGIDIVAGCVGMSEDQLRAAGAPNKTARTLLTLADALFAPTSFTPVSYTHLTLPTNREV